MQQIHPYEFEVIYQDEQVKTKEERTVTMNGQVLTNKEVDKEETQRVLIYDLYLGAQSLSLAKKMEQERDEYFASLYDFSYGISNLTEEPLYLGSTDSNAIKIIEEKETYNKKIVRLKERYSRFRALLLNFKEQDRQLLRSYFEHGQKKNYEEIQACVRRLEKYISRIEKAREKMLERQTMDDYQEQLKSIRAQQGRENFQTNWDEQKQQHLVDGRFVYMSKQEYQDHMDKLNKPISI